MSEFRIEKDSLGEVRVPAQAYYGAETQRAVENSSLSGKPLPPALIRGSSPGQRSGGNCQSRSRSVAAANRRCHCRRLAKSPTGTRCRVSGRSVSNRVGTSLMFTFDDVNSYRSTGNSAASAPLVIFREPPAQWHRRLACGICQSRSRSVAAANRRCHCAGGSRSRQRGTRRRVSDRRVSNRLGHFEQHERQRGDRQSRDRDRWWRSLRQQQADPSERSCEHGAEHERYCFRRRSMSRWRWRSKRI